MEGVKGWGKGGTGGGKGREGRDEGREGGSSEECASHYFIRYFVVLVVLLDTADANELVIAQTRRLSPLPPIGVHC